MNHKPSTEDVVSQKLEQIHDGLGIPTDQLRCFLGGKGAVVVTFFRLTCSEVLWGGRNTANKYHWCRALCSQCLSHNGFAPTHGLCAFPVYTAQALGCSAGNCLRLTLGCIHFLGLSHSGSGTRVLLKGADSVGPGFCALSRSELLR